MDINKKTPQSANQPANQPTPQTSEPLIEQPELELAEQQQTPQTVPLDPLQEMTDLLKRTQANFENYRKQTEKRVEDIKLTAAKDVILQLLPILDNFQLAIGSAEKNIEKNPQAQDLLKGIELIYAQFNELLEKNDVHPLHTQHQLFSPYHHEALMKVPSELPENTIIEEFQRGYTLHGQVIRHARVKISAGKKA